MRGEGLLSTPADVVAAIGGDRRLATWKVRPPSRELAGQDDALEIEVVGLSPRWQATGLGSPGPLVLVLAWPSLWLDGARLERHLARARGGNFGIVLVGTDADFQAVEGDVDGLVADRDLSAISVPTSVTRLALALRARAEATATRLLAASLELELERAHYENELLISIGRALSQQRDIQSLLEIILRRTREVTGADAGSVYVVEGEAAAEEGAPEVRTLRFAVSQNDSKHIASKGFTMAVSPSSIVGACVLSSDVINIPDLYGLDAPGTGNNPWGFVHDRSFDDRHDYQTRSMLTVPMISARSQVIGVIQLINKRAKGVVALARPQDFEAGVVPFDQVAIAFATTLASQAGIALENALLYDEVRTLFEGFVRASVVAIEARDPTTSGHSERVASLTVGLAAVVDKSDEPSFRGLRFSADDLKEIEYAALLHDFGKVGVREHVLVKAKKLYEHQRELIVQRFHFIKRGLELEGLRRKVEYQAAASRDRIVEDLGGGDDLARTLLELDDFVGFILNANEPTVLEQGGFDRIADIAARRYLHFDGSERPFLEDEEVRALQVLRGSLTAEERIEIESHVVHTYNFLRQIPWGRTFRRIPEIAGSHHEKLDGTGYPNRLTADQIPMPARMMTISDIYDALTAKDRPYKRAIPLEKALDILAADVKKGVLDPELFRVFVEAKVYDLTRTTDERPRRLPTNRP